MNVRDMDFVRTGKRPASRSTKFVTRFAGYKFVMETSNVNGAVQGAFENPADIFELRSTYFNESGQLVGIMAAAQDAISTLYDRVEDVATRHSFWKNSCHCESCEIFYAMYSRLHMA